MRIFNQLLPAVALAALVSAPNFVHSQETQHDNIQAAASRNVQHVLNQQLIETKHFNETMPLAKFLVVLQEQIKENKISLRIDKDAFGAQFDEVAATPVVLPPYPKTMYLSTALTIARSKIKLKHDYRFTPTEFFITTSERALYVAGYDIRPILEKPEAMQFYAKWNAFRDNERRRQGDSVQKTGDLVRAIVAMIDVDHDKNLPPNRVPIEILNGNRLVVRANAAKHAEVESLLNAFRRLGDLWVIANARLYEVDDAFYTKVKNAKRLSRQDLDEEETRLANGLPSKHEVLFKFLANHKIVLAGADVKVDSGFEATFLSKHRALSFRPSREQIRKGNKDRQAVLEGIAIVGGIHVSPDRRYVRIKLTEKAAEFDAIEKEKLLVDNEGKEEIAETPLLKEIVHTQTRDIPDGGSILLPVHYRPRELRDKNRWWVVVITPRIFIPEEEEQVQLARLEATLPLIVADILKNPRLKATREFYGSANDNRFALVDSAAWTWPKAPKLDTPGHQVTPANKIGHRMLGIRVERINDDITVSLVNAGGNENGAVVGNGTLRYTTRETEKGWTIALQE